MDPRIHWEDILMRIEVPNRTVTSDQDLQNSTNNLINRQEHRYNFMLAWHTTGARGQRANTVRSMALQRVATAQPPLPPNSTRGLTPGLINPALGSFPGNSAAQPVLGANQGRLRVGLGQGRGPQIPAPAYPAPNIVSISYCIEAKLLRDGTEKSLGETSRAIIIMPIVKGSVRAHLDRL